MSARNAQSLGLVGERNYVEFDRAVRFPVPAVHRQPGWHGSVPLRLWFRRLYFDGDIAGRFEFGFRSEIQAETRIFGGDSDAEYDLAQASRTVLDASVEVRSEDGSTHRSRLEVCSDALGLAYLTATTLHELLPEYPAAELYGTALKIGSPLVHVRVSADVPIKPRDDRRSVLEDNQGSLAIMSVAHAQRRNTLTVQTSCGLPRQEESIERARRVLFSHLNSLLYAHSHLLQVMSAREIKASKVQLRDLTQRMLARLERFNPGGKQASDLAFADAVRAFARAHEGRVDELTGKLQALEREAAEPSALAKAGNYAKSLFELITTTAVEATVKSVGPYP
jgi:hypothetical protein